MYTINHTFEQNPYTKTIEEWMASVETMSGNCFANDAGDIVMVVHNAASGDLWPVLLNHPLDWNTVYPVISPQSAVIAGQFRRVDIALHVTERV